MGRKKKDRSDKVLIAFEATKPVLRNLKDDAHKRDMSVSEFIRMIIELFYETR